jgi:hypothetical protein
MPCPESLAMPSLRFLTVSLAILFSSQALAHTATVVTIDKTGAASETKYELTSVGNDVLRLTIPLKDIKPDAKHLDIQADFATARKGDDGYWIFARGIYGTFRLDQGAIGNSPLIPIYGMKTPVLTFVAIVNGMNYEYTVHVEAKGGVYRMFQRYAIADIGFPPYEDINVDFHMLKGNDATYSGMARAYRKYQLDRVAVKSIKQRIQSGESPYLNYLCDALALRIPHSAKPWVRDKRVDYTPETELPIKTSITFDAAKGLVSKIKDAGIDKLAICVAGWQTGGYDGRCPQTFPVDEGAGGEAKLREYIQHARSLGFLIDAHSNYTDAFTVSPMWSKDLVCKKPDGTLATNGIWDGGNAYNLCPRNAWEQFFQSEIERIGQLGFRGAHYIDVFSATRPYHCTDPKHPCNRKEAGEYQKKMLHKAKAVFGGAASECGWDHVAGELDYINYTATSMATYYRKKQKPEIVDGVVPLWEIVYHGIILYNPDKITQGKLDARNALRLVEFGGRPFFYGASESTIPTLKAAYEAFKPVRYLQREFMESHEYLVPDVALVKYSDGSEILSNASDKAFTYKGRAVKPMSYELYRPTK